MGIEINGDLGQISCWEKLICGANGHQGKWAFAENGHLGIGVGYPKFLKGVPQVPRVHFPNVCIWPLWQMGTWTFGGKEYLRYPNGVLQVPCAHFPQIFENGQWGK